MVSVGIQEKHLSDAGVWNVAGNVLDSAIVQQTFDSVDVADSKCDVVDPCLDFGVRRGLIFGFDQVNLESLVEQPGSSKVKARSIEWLESKHVTVKPDALVEVTSDSGHVVDIFNR